MKKCWASSRFDISSPMTRHFLLMTAPALGGDSNPEEQSGWKRTGDGEWPNWCKHEKTRMGHWIKRRIYRWTKTYRGKRPVCRSKHYHCKQKWNSKSSEKSRAFHSCCSAGQYRRNLGRFFLHSSSFRDWAGLAFNQRKIGFTVFNRYVERCMIVL